MKITEFLEILFYALLVLIAILAQFGIKLPYVALLFLAYAVYRLFQDGILQIVLVLIATAFIFILLYFDLPPQYYLGFVLVVIIHLTMRYTGLIKEPDEMTLHRDDPLPPEAQDSNKEDDQ